MAETDANDGNTGSENTGTENTQTGSSETENTETLSPEALRTELTRARQEAAKYRVKAKYAFADEDAYNKAKSAVEALDKAEQDKKTEVERLTEKNEGLQFNAAKHERELLSLRAALAAGVDASQADELSKRLQGDNFDELKSDAEKLVQFFGSNTQRRGDHSQGRGNDSGNSNMNPLEAALRNAIGK